MAIASATKELSIAAGGPSHSYLVFTSAGDRGSVERWLDGPRSFDLWITYYGDAGARYEDLGTYYNRRKGSKFQNLHYAYHHWRHLFGRYSAIMVIDDDIRITASGLNRLFEVREEHDLWVLQPAFSPWGKFSYSQTLVDRTSRLRYTKFVEVTCPVFRREHLEAFLAVYDPCLVGYGIDQWFLHVMGDDLSGKVAIVDEVTCLNPHDWMKGGGREIDSLQSLPERIAAWQRIKAQHGISKEDGGETEYRRVFRGIAARSWGRLIGRPERLAAWGISGAIRKLAELIGQSPPRK